MTKPHDAIAATLEFSAAPSSTWDALVIGAGVAGASVAILLTRAGLKTLLVEAKKFPREKVCGGCLNQRAQEALARLGVLDQLVKQGAVPLTEFRLRLPRTDIRWPMPPLLSVSRSTLDGLLVRTAIDAGAQFLPETRGQLISKPATSRASRGTRRIWETVSGRLDPETAVADSGVRNVQLSNGDTTNVVNARIVMVADGLTRSSLERDAGWESTVARGSRIGVQTIVPQPAFPSWDKHRLEMVVGSRGYVGFSAVDGDRIDIAAAIDPAGLSRKHGLADAVKQILHEGGASDWIVHVESGWQATPLLTRASRQTAGHRVFLLGDAIGYVEPFTGEGMAWALASAQAVMPIAIAASKSWNDQHARHWMEWVQRETNARQRTCRMLTRCLRSPKLTAWMVFGCRWLPPLRRELMRRVSQ